VKPFLDFFKKELSFEWKEEQLWAFEDLKKKHSFAFVLRFLDFIKPFEVRINANDFAIGKVLMQDGHPITFKSKKLRGAHL